MENSVEVDTQQKKSIDWQRFKVVIVGCRQFCCLCTS